MPPAHEPRPYSVLTDAEIVRLFDALDESTTAKGKPRSRERRERDRAILAVMLGAGLRAAEVVALEVRDVAAGEGGIVLAVSGKGGKRREVPIREDVAAPVLRYLNTTGRRLGDGGALFLREGARDGGHLTTRTIGMLTADYAGAAGIEAARAFSPHACRHTYAVRASREGLTVAALRRALGHASVATTGRYLDHIGLADLRENLPDLPTRESVGA
jgi:integrase